jgi:hypothetical protein
MKIQKDPDTPRNMDSDATEEIDADDTSQTELSIPSHYDSSPDGQDGQMSNRGKSCFLLVRKL